MLWIFKKAKFLYLGLLLVGFILLVILGFYIQSPVIPFILFLLWTPICATIGNHQAMKYHHKVTDILANECDPEKFLKAYEPLLKASTGKYRFMFYMYRCSALEAAGKYEEAMYTLKNIGGFPKGHDENILKLAYYSQLFNHHINSKDIENAEVSLAFIKKIIDSEKFRESDKLKNKVLYEQEKYRLNIEKGFYDGAEQIMLSMLEYAETELRRISVKFALGKIYFHQSKKDEAKNAFEYIVTHGNKLAMVDKARTYLAQL